MESDMHARTHARTHARRKEGKQAGWLAGWLAGRHARSQHGKGDSTTYDQRRTGWWDWVKEREGESRKKGRLDLVREGCARLNNETATKFDP